MNLSGYGSAGDESCAAFGGGQHGTLSQRAVEMEHGDGDIKSICAEGRGTKEGDKKAKLA